MSNHLGSLENSYKASMGTLLELADYKEVAVMIQKILVMIGASDVNIPPGDQQKIVIEQVKQHFHSFTVDEVLLAFSLLVSGAIYFDGLETKLYNQRFSVAYMTPIMMRFKAYKMSLRRGVRESDLQVESEIDDAARRRIMISGVKRVYREYLANSEFLDMGSAVYYFLVEEGKVTIDQDIKEMSLEAAERERTSMQLKSDMAVNRETRRQMVRLLESFDITKEADRKARMLAVDFFLSDLKEAGKTEEDIDQMFNQ